MRETLLSGLALLAAGACAAAPASQSPPGDLVVSEYVAPQPLRLSARTLREYAVPEVDQGVAADARHFYAVDNSVIAKYERDGGQLVSRWVGPDNVLIRHLN